MLLSSVVLATLLVPATRKGLMARSERVSVEYSRVRAKAHAVLASCRGSPSFMSQSAHASTASKLQTRISLAQHVELRERVRDVGHWRHGGQHAVQGSVAASESSTCGEQEGSTSSFVSACMTLDTDSAAGSTRCRAP